MTPAPPARRYTAAVVLLVAMLASLLTWENTPAAHADVSSVATLSGTPLASGLIALGEVGTQVPLFLSASGSTLTADVVLPDDSTPISANVVLPESFSAVDLSPVTIGDGSVLAIVSTTAGPFGVHIAVAPVEVPTEGQPAYSVSIDTPSRIQHVDGFDAVSGYWADAVDYKFVGSDAEGIVLESASYADGDSGWGVAPDLSSIMSIAPCSDLPPSSVPTISRGATSRWAAYLTEGTLSFCGPDSESLVTPVTTDLTGVQEVLDLGPFATDDEHHVLAITDGSVVEVYHDGTLLGHFTVPSGTNILGLDMVRGTDFDAPNRLVIRTDKGVAVETMDEIAAANGLSATALSPILTNASFDTAPVLVSANDVTPPDYYLAIGSDVYDEGDLTALVGPPASSPTPPADTTPSIPAPVVDPSAGTVSVSASAPANSSGGTDVTLTNAIIDQALASISPNTPTLVINATPVTPTSPAPGSTLPAPPSSTVTIPQSVAQAIANASNVSSVLVQTTTNDVTTTVGLSTTNLQALADAGGSTALTISAPQSGPTAANGVADPSTQSTVLSFTATVGNRPLPDLSGPAYISTAIPDLSTDASPQVLITSPLTTTTTSNGQKTICARTAATGLRPLDVAPPNSPIGSLNPGLYVQVIDGMINISNSAGSQNFSAGQFGFTPSFSTPPVILPNNPGLVFTPPPSFNSSGTGVPSSSPPKGVDCTVRRTAATATKPVTVKPLTTGTATVSFIAPSLGTYLILSPKTISTLLAPAHTPVVALTPRTKSLVVSLPALTPGANYKVRYRAKGAHVWHIVYIGGTKKTLTIRALTSKHAYQILAQAYRTVPTVGTNGAVSKKTFFAPLSTIKTAKAK